VRPHVKLVHTAFDPIATAFVTAVATGHIPPELADSLDYLGNTPGWAALVTALRRVLAGDRDREHLLAGLDDTETAILTTILDRLSIEPGPDPSSPASLNARGRHR
jgi:hypothetical protein